MPASTREEIVEVFEACDAVRDRMGELSFDALAVPELLRAIEREVRNERRSRATRHALINQLARRANKKELGGTLARALADRMRISTAESGRWIAEAEDLGARQAITGEPLPPKLPQTAAAQREGLIGDGNIAVIRKFFKHLPAQDDPGVEAHAEADLAGHARDFRPEQVTDYARDVMALLHPDGDYTEEERARKRGLTLGNQQYDGMSRLSGLITPELRAEIEALLAALAAPGRCNLADQIPTLDDNPDPDAITRDTRSTVQRNHDAMLFGIRTLFKSGKLGEHNGLPVSIIITADLKDLEAGSGKARTAGGTLVPMSDVYRWAGDAHHYLALFDGAKPQALYHKQRFATKAQRLMLYASQRGCTRPGCNAPAHQTQVHHVTPWRDTHRTHINDLALACGIDNRLAENGWTTRTNTKGHVEWLPPAHLDYGQPRINTFHHPERLFRTGDEDDKPK